MGGLEARGHQNLAGQHDARRDAMGWDAGCGDSGPIPTSTTTSLYILGHGTYCQGRKGWGRLHTPNFWLFRTQWEETWRLGSSCLGTGLVGDGGLTALCLVGQKRGLEKENPHLEMGCVIWKGNSWRNGLWGASARGSAWTVSVDRGGSALRGAVPAEAGDRSRVWPGK